MDQNLFQVISENNLDEILSNNPQKLVLIMLSSKNCGPCKIIKPKFVGLSKQHNDVFFIYVDISNYAITTNKYFAEYEYTPTFLFYFNGSKVAFIKGAREQSLYNTLTVVKQKIEEKRQELMQREKLLEMQKLQELQNMSFNVNHTNQNLPQHNTQPSQIQPPQIQPPQKVYLQQNDMDNSDLLQKKIDALNKLRELVQHGIKLTRPYNLESDYEDIIFELQFQSNPQFRQQFLKNNQHNETQNVQTPFEIQSQNTHHQQYDQTPINVEPPKQTNDAQIQLQKKQDQVRQIQELNMLNQKMQMESFQKLQQLKRIQLMKEQQERNNMDKKEGQ